MSILDFYKSYRFGLLLFMLGAQGLWAASPTPSPPQPEDANQNIKKLHVKLRATPYDAFFIDLHEFFYVADDSFVTLGFRAHNRSHFFGQKFQLKITMAWEADTKYSFTYEDPHIYTVEAGEKLEVKVDLSSWLEAMGQEGLAQLAQAKRVDAKIVGHGTVYTSHALARFYMNHRKSFLTLGIVCVTALGCLFGHFGMEVTWIALLLTLLVTLLTWWEPLLHDDLQCVPYRIWHHHEWYRLLTSGFLHATYRHFVLNMLCLFVHGGISNLYIIKAISCVGILTQNHVKHVGLLFWACYLGGIVIGSAAYLTCSDEELRSVGASAGVCALMSASILLNPSRFMCAILLIDILVACYFHYSAEQPSDLCIAHKAHLAGWLYGIFFILCCAPHVVAKSFLPSFNLLI